MLYFDFQHNEPDEKGEIVVDLGEVFEACVEQVEAADETRSTEATIEFLNSMLGPDSKVSATATSFCRLPFFICRPILCMPPYPLYASISCLCQPILFMPPYPLYFCSPQALPLVFATCLRLDQIVDLMPSLLITLFQESSHAVGFTVLQ